ncbi:MAG TPA: hypothetical protein VEV82_00775 [Actinomycetota bacterium]|nr:hypothetical protein [Actinomycetota bacterium]
MLAETSAPGAQGAAWAMGAGNVTTKVDAAKTAIDRRVRGFFK